MENDALLKEVTAKAQQWLGEGYDAETRAEVQRMLDNEDKTDLIEAFYKDLEFGTGGLRGIMGVGSNRMNIYTVGAATQGLANYLKKEFASLPQIKVVIGHDCRNNSRKFAEISADIFSANGIKVYLFESLRPTPEMSYTIRELGCQSGIILTASHNPKEYNGYKAYWDDGAQMVSPHDKNTISEVNKVRSVSDINFKGNPALVEIIGKEIDEKYIARIKALSLNPDAIARQHDLKIVYTPIHGTGVTLIPQALAAYGFTQVIHVPEQDVISGDFPTVKSPNPEEPAALDLAIRKAKEVDADIVLASDPDADRIGIAVPDEEGNYVLLNGNQTCVLLTYYICRRWSETGRLDGHQFVVKTIVTSEMVAEVARSFGVKVFDCLTGFKYIAGIIRRQEPLGEKYIGGGEESFGYLPEDFVRDKDGVSSCALAAEAAAWAKSIGTTLYQLIKELYVKYGFYKEGLVSIVRKGQEGQEEIHRMMVDWRTAPPKVIAGSSVAVIRDYLTGESRDLTTGKVTPIDMEKSDVLQFITADRSMVSVRPSGTEPKIKYYFSVREPLDAIDRYDAVGSELDAKLERIKKDLRLE